MNPGLVLLTDRERECLRLLLKPMRAKGIARELGLSYHTVNDHLRSARGKLGTVDSLSAAQLLRTAEGEPPNIVGTSGLGFPVQPLAPQEVASEDVGGAHTTPWPLAVRGRPWNAMSLRWRLLWPLIIAAGAVFAAGIFVAALAALSSLYLDLRR